MSSSARPRAIDDVDRRLRTTNYWCRRCQRSVGIVFTYPYAASCPHCLGQLSQELGLSRPRLLTSVSRIDSNLLDSLTEMLQDTNFDWRIVREPEEDGSRRSHGAGFLLQFASSAHLPQRDGNENAWPGVPTTPASAVEALERVRVTQTHLANDSHCPVCRDEFEVGAEVKIMPCKHFYHPECIDPWLRLHNTCPVCRYELPASLDDDGQNSTRNFQFEDLRGAMSWTWNRVLSLWPFRMFSGWTHHDPDNLEDENPWWRPWLII